ncbi:hypothetical protein CIP107547_00365 [Corynebacterium diphtheriae]|uniref:Uncharacterized protein n=1 Tax=Corynebacterium diphtheriae TaxID=1717 RepID=A0A811G8I0_CORDP|nr:hypothetical protein CIP107547_00365 [Corynebacterium diphtheriae]
MSSDFLDPESKKSLDITQLYQLVTTWGAETKPRENRDLAQKPRKRLQHIQHLTEPLLPLTQQYYPQRYLIKISGFSNRRIEATEDLDSIELHRQSPKKFYFYIFLSGPNKQRQTCLSNEVTDNAKPCPIVYVTKIFSLNVE